MTPFFDTNIVVYAFLDMAKRERALDLIASGGVISAQVLNEFTNVARRTSGIMAQTPPGSESDPGAGDFSTFKDCRP